MSKLSIRPVLVKRTPVEQHSIAARVALEASAKTEPPPKTHLDLMRERARDFFRRYELTPPPEPYRARGESMAAFEARVTALHDEHALFYAIVGAFDTGITYGPRLDRESRKFLLRAFFEAIGAKPPAFPRSCSYCGKRGHYCSACPDATETARAARQVEE